MRERSAVGAWLLGTRAQRRVGLDAVCATCGKERRPFALISGSTPPCCFACDRLAQGRMPFEYNHVFGHRNSDLTIRYPVNDHRAVLSVKQYHWPPGVLENPNGSPLRASVAQSEGLYDNIEHMLAEHKVDNARLVRIEELLTTVYGSDWLPKLEAVAARASRKRALQRGRARRDQ